MATSAELYRTKDGETENVLVGRLKVGDYLPFMGEIVHTQSLASRGRDEVVVVYQDTDSKYHAEVLAGNRTLTRQNRKLRGRIDCTADELRLIFRALGTMGREGYALLRALGAADALTIREE